MDSRLKLIEIKRFYENIKSDFNLSSDKIDKQDKVNCFKGIISNLFKVIWNGITSPIIYTIWYLFRNQITTCVYKGTSWRDILDLMDNNKTDKVKKLLVPNGRFYYWIWTYGDAEDPLGRGGLPDKYKNNFWNRLYWSGIRNGRYNYACMEFRTGQIIQVVTSIDDRDFTYMHKSFGIGDSPNGIYFKWMKDDKGKWYFIYEDNNENNLFYLGYTGLLKYDIGNSGGRFETGYRVTDSSYHL